MAGAVRGKEDENRAGQENRKMGSSLAAAFGLALLVACSQRASSSSVDREAAAPLAHPAHAPVGVRISREGRDYIFHFHRCGTLDSPITPIAFLRFGIEARPYGEEDILVCEAHYNGGGVQPLAEPL